ncbi:MAG: hypothetical protein ACYTGW_02250, partial [Planctomycetota bacterium]
LDRTLKLGMIPWAEVQGAYLEFTHGEERICLEIRSPQDPTANISEVTLDLSGLSLPTEEVLGIIQRRSHRAHS